MTILRKFNQIDTIAARVLMNFLKTNNCHTIIMAMHSQHRVLIYKTSQVRQFKVTAILLSTGCIQALWAFIG